MNGPTCSLVSPSSLVKSSSLSPTRSASKSQGRFERISGEDQLK